MRLPSWVLLAAACGSSTTPQPGAAPPPASATTATATAGSPARVPTLPALEVSPVTGPIAPVPRYASRVTLPAGPFRAFYRDTVSCGLRRDGTLACFAESGAPLPDYAPKGTFKELQYQLGIGCAIRDDDHVACFGRSEFSAAPVPPRTTVRAIGLDGATLCWIDAKGALGCVGDQLVTGPRPRGTFEKVACASHDCCAIATGGALRCWGEHNELLAPPKGRYTSIAVEGVLGCAVDTAGTLACWGAPDELPREAASGAVASMTLANRQVCIVRSDHTGRCLRSWKPGSDLPAPIAWWQDQCGVTLDGDPVCVGDVGFGPVPTGEFVDLVGGNDAMCALDATGRARCWGTRDYLGFVPAEPLAQLGFGSVKACWRTRASQDIHCRGYEAVDPPGTLPSFAVGTAVCGIVDRRVVCAGKEPKQPPPAVDAVQVSSGEATACAITGDGHVACWPTFGYIADHVETVAPPTGAGFATVTVGYEHACALAGDGHATCWGRDVGGETAAPTGPAFVQLALGEKRSCGLVRDGTVRCWGGDPAAPPPSWRFDKIAITTDKALDEPAFVCGILHGSHAVACWAYEKPR